jgi:hypothetical protein
MRTQAGRARPPCVTHRSRPPNRAGPSGTVHRLGHLIGHHVKVRNIRVAGHRQAGGHGHGDVGSAMKPCHPPHIIRPVGFRPPAPQGAGLPPLDHIDEVRDVRAAEPSPAVTERTRAGRVRSGVTRPVATGTGQGLTGMELVEGVLWSWRVVCGGIKGRRQELSETRSGSARH